MVSASCGRLALRDATLKSRNRRYAKQTVRDIRKRIAISLVKLFKLTGVG